MTAGVNPPIPDTFTATEDITVNRFVKYGAANSVDAVDAVTDKAIGVAAHTVDASEANALSVWTLNKGGIIPVEAAAAITAGAKVAPSANGRAQTAVTGQFPRGIALEAATGAGHVIAMLVQVEEVAV